MNLTQNDRLKQVTSDTLIVGVDVGSQTHFCRAFDWRGFELSRRVFKFSNTGMGFLTFLRWTKELTNKTERLLSAASLPVATGSLFRSFYKTMIFSL